MLDFSGIPDKVLVSNVRNKACSDSFNELSRRHSDLFYKVCHTYLPLITTRGHLYEDILEEKDFVIYDAILKYNELKNTKFVTWLGNYTRFFCLNKINRNRSVAALHEEQESHPLLDSSSLDEFNHPNKSIDFEVILDELSKEDSRIVEIFQLRYDPRERRRRTWNCIAEKMDLSIQSTIHLHKKGISLIKQKIKENNLEVFN